MVVKNTKTTNTKKTKKTKKTTKKKQPVLILDCHRGVYFGNLVEVKDNPGSARKSVKLEGMRHCFYYPVAPLGHRGVYGLATYGPGEGAKVGPSVNAWVFDVVKIVDCTEEAVERWNTATWE